MKLVLWLAFMLCFNYAICDVYCSANTENYPVQSRSWCTDSSDLSIYDIVVDVNGDGSIYYIEGKYTSTNSPASFNPLATFKQRR